MSTLLLVGLGDLGAVILDLAARESCITRIVAASRHADRGTRRVNLARLSAVADARDTALEFVRLDLTDRESVAGTVGRVNPDIIVHTATMQSWWAPDMLPEPHAASIKRAGFGVWLPVHLTLTRKLMEAVREIGYDGPVLSAPYPDVVNCVLDKLGLAPTCGLGNVDEIVPKVRWLVAERLRVPLDSVQVFLVAHHALEHAAFTSDPANAPPYLLQVVHRGRDVTQEVAADDLLFQPMPVSAGRVTHSLTASTALRLIRSVLGNQETFVHAPGPNGLPGGYPLWAGQRQVRLALPADWSEDEAVSVNEQSHPYDGISSIESDGTVTFAGDAAAVLRETLGYDCVRLPPAEVDERATELVTRFREYARGHGVSS